MPIIGFPLTFIVRSRISGYLNLSRDGALDDVVVDKGSTYRAAMHSRPYIVKHWGEYFEVSCDRRCDCWIAGFCGSAATVVEQLVEGGAAARLIDPWRGSDAAALGYAICTD